MNILNDICYAVVIKECGRCIMIIKWNRSKVKYKELHSSEKSPLSKNYDKLFR